MLLILSLNIEHAHYSELDAIYALIPSFEKLLEPKVNSIILHCSYLAVCFFFSRVVCFLPRRVCFFPRIVCFFYSSSIVQYFVRKPATARVESVAKRGKRNKCPLEDI